MQKTGILLRSTPAFLCLASASEADFVSITDRRTFHTLQNRFQTQAGPQICGHS